MDIEHLQAVTELSQGELDDFWSRFQLEGGGDVSAFLQWLRQARMLDTATLKAVFTEPVSMLATDDYSMVVDEGERYEELGLVGKGAFGEVVAAKELALSRTVALKRLLPEKADDPELTKRFLREVQITAQLEHPAIMPIYALDEDANGRPVAAMKLVRGRDLRRYLKECREQAAEPDPEHSLETRLDHFIRVCEAVAYAHDRGIIHRDLKPANVMIGPHQGEVYVMDWGLARPIRAETLDQGFIDLVPDAPTAGSPMLTLAGHSLGTPDYMSPEQASGAAGLDHRSDLYTLGLILFELVSLQRAVPGRGEPEKLANALQGKTNELVHIAGLPIPPALAAIVARATEPHIGYRYREVSELSAEVRRFLQGDAVKAAPERKVEEVLRRAGGREELGRKVLAFTIVALLAFAAGALLT